MYSIAWHFVIQVKLIIIVLFFLVFYRYDMQKLEEGPAREIFVLLKSVATSKKPLHLNRQRKKIYA